MKKALLLSTLLFNYAMMHTDSSNVDLTIDLKDQNSCAKHADVNVNLDLNASEAVHVSTESFDLDIIARSVNNTDDMVEIAIAVNEKTGEKSSELIALPVVKAEYAQEEQVVLYNKDNSASLTITCTAHKIENEEEAHK